MFTTSHQPIPLPPLSHLLSSQLSSLFESLSRILLRTRPKVDDDALAAAAPLFCAMFSSATFRKAGARLWQVTFQDAVFLVYPACMQPHLDAWARALGLRFPGYADVFSPQNDQVCGVAVEGVECVCACKCM